MTYLAIWLKRIEELNSQISTITQEIDGIGELTISISESLEIWESQATDLDGRLKLLVDELAELEEEGY